MKRDMKSMRADLLSLYERRICIIIQPIRTTVHWRLQILFSLSALTFVILQEKMTQWPIVQLIYFEKEQQKGGFKMKTLF